MKTIITLLKNIKGYIVSSIMTPACMLVEVAMEIIVPMLMASLVDKGIEVPGGDMGHIVKIGGLMLVCAVVGLIAGILGGKFGAHASAGFAKNLRRSMFDNIQTFSFSNIDKFSTAGLVTRLTTDVTNLQNAYMMALRMATRSAANLVLAMVASFLINKNIALVYVGAIVFLILILAIIGGSALKSFMQVFRRYDDLNASVQENISSIRVVKAFVREEHEIVRFKNASGKVHDLFVKAEKLLIINMPAMMFAVYACILVISWIGAHLIVSETITKGNLMSLLAYCMTILMSLMMLSMVFVMITMSIASANRIAEVINEKTDIKNPENPVMDVADGSIEFKEVNFRYNQDAEENVLKDINLSIAAGETIGIIGGTGSAKTSLVNLISRLYDVSEGELLVGGVDVRQYDLETLRNQVSVVLQKNTLFSGSIYDNLRWGNLEATDEECQKACELACASEFIEAMPDGYNTHIEQGGSNVSGGQKQRLCIARALLKKPKILILDDSTSAVDTATDAKIRKCLAEEIPNTTKLIIAQRISSVQHADRILVLHNGCINGIGTHDELIANNDIYREVYESQSQPTGDFDAI